MIDRTVSHGEAFPLGRTHRASSGPGDIVKTLLGLPWRDAASALAVMGIGAFGVIEALGYRLGELRNIGPGAFPLGVGVLLLACGVLIVAEGRMAAPGAAEDPAASRAPLRVILLVCGGLLSFVLLMPRFGAVPGIVACVVISAHADGSLRLWQVLLLAAGMAAFCAFVFAGLLNLPLELLTW
jgi:hypothetical protein